MEQFTCLFAYFEGYRVDSVSEVQGKSGPEYLFTLDPEPNGELICERCGQACRSIHDRSSRVIRDLPVFGRPARLLLPRRRVWCMRCGPSLERLSWLERNARVTRRLADYAAALLEMMTVQDAASILGLDWKTVRSLDKRQLQHRFGELDLQGVRLLAMDEFAIQKGHRYATVIIDYETRRVLWVGRGRARTAVRPFFESLSLEQRCQIEAVAMDMNSSFELEVKKHCPQAQIVFDLFHVVAKYGREVIGRVRVDEANRLRADKRGRKLVKGAHWLLLRNRENIEREADQVRLQELLSANAPLLAVYVLKDDLKAIWKQNSLPAARSLWEAWISRCLESGIAPLVRFAKNLASYVDGILSSSRWKINTSVLEGINNRIKVIKRMAYGYRDDEYFFLKIKSAFPGIRR